MEIRQIRSLILLAECGSLKTIAEKVHLSSPSVYRQIKTLEEELGVPLYERVGQNLVPTEAARLMLPELRGVLDRCDSALAVLNEWKGVKRGRIRIGAGPIASTYLLPRILKRFVSQYPGAKISLLTGSVQTLVENLNAGAIDVAFLAYHERYAPPRLDLSLLDAICQVEMVIVSKGRPPAHGRSLRSFKDVPFVQYQETSPLSQWIERYLADANLQPSVIIRCDRSETIKSMVMEGLGIAMLPLWAVAAEVRSGTLSLIRQRERPMLLSMGIARQDSPRLSPAVRVFLEIVRRFAIPRPPGRST